MNDTSAAATATNPIFQGLLSNREVFPVLYLEIKKMYRKKQLIIRELITSGKELSMND